MSRGRFRNSRFHHPHAPSSTRKACKIHWFSVCFKHMKKFDAISKHRPLTAPQPQALSENSPKNFDVFLAEFYWGFVNFKQRRRRRTINFARKRTSNGAADVLYISHQQRHRRRTITFVEIVNGAGATSTFCSMAKKWSVPLNMACTSRMIIKRKRRGDVCFR